MIDGMSEDELKKIIPYNHSQSLNKIICQQFINKDLIEQHMMRIFFFN